MNFLLKLLNRRLDEHYTSKFKNADSVIYQERFEEPSSKLKMLGAAFWQLQFDSFFSIFAGMSGSVQNVLICSFDSLDPFQKEKVCQEVFFLQFSPSNELKKFLIGFACSLIFAGGSSGVIRRVLCILQKYSNHYSKLLNMQLLCLLVLSLREY